MSLKRKEICNEYRVTCTKQHSESAPLADDGGELREVVTSTYLTKGGPYRKDSFQFMRGFFMTSMRQNFSVLVFHNELSTNFQNRLYDIYDKTEFFKIKKLNGRSVNDARYYILYDYLLNHPGVKHIVLQDIKDGTFPKNPFKVMEAMGDILYRLAGILHFMFLSLIICGGILNLRYLESAFQLKIFQTDEAKYHPFINAGTIGGSRDGMLTFLTRLKQCLDDWAPHDKNCNMACVGLVTHHYFLEHSYNGYPFQASYKAGVGVARGSAITHKHRYV